MARNIDECRICEGVWEEKRIWEGTKSEQWERALLYWEASGRSSLLVSALSTYQRKGIGSRLDILPRFKRWSVSLLRQKGQSNQTWYTASECSCSVTHSMIICIPFLAIQMCSTTLHFWLSNSMHVKIEMHWQPVTLTLSTYLRPLEWSKPKMSPASVTIGSSCV